KEIGEVEREARKGDDLETFGNGGENHPQSRQEKLCGYHEFEFSGVLSILENCYLLKINEGRMIVDLKFMVIVAQKTHHTKFFQPNSKANIPPGTIIDNKSTTQPTHYHVLLDQIGFSTDDLQELVHFL
ncbi:Ribonuclease H-like domain-containing protein, partial [Cynara cardunculus var. scolymus]